MSDKKHLGDCFLAVQKFETLSLVFAEFKTPSFLALHEGKKKEKVNRALYHLIKEAKTPCFLLPAVTDYIEQIHVKKVLESYAFAHFELWLNQFSQLSAEENYQVRSKITGKNVPRSAYQSLFPIGMDKVYPGSHFVTAHSSPDVDTTIASFWGWVDAFSARVSEGLHMWNVPGGAPVSLVEIGLLFYPFFGKNVFSILSKTHTTLSLSGMDLMTQQGLIRETVQASTLEIDHERMQKAVVLLDAEGFYLGDWRSVDVEGVRQVIALFSHALRWFSNQVQLRIVGFFAQKEVSLKIFSSLVTTLLEMRVEEASPVKSYTQKQRQYLQDYLVHVLKINQGLECSFLAFTQGMKEFSLEGFPSAVEHLLSLKTLEISRPELFSYVEKVMSSFDKAIEQMGSFVERLDIALKIKTQVFGHLPHHVNYHADVDEIKQKMGFYPYLSVTSSDSSGDLLPLGVIHAKDLQKPLLGTVTLRDFCNREETKIPSYLEVISVIDHHRSQLSTASAPMVLICDAQSSNVLCAEVAFSINDRFSTGGMTQEQIEKQIETLQKELTSSENKKLFAKLLQRQWVYQENRDHFVDPARETLEYLHFLYGIFDDTDLLSKVSMRDLECVVQLVNRLKSLFLKKEVEILSLRDLPREGDFIKKARLRILQHPDVHSLYQKISLAKEKAMDAGLLEASRGEGKQFFSDTKEQNGCARVGQAKLFPSNLSLFSQHKSALKQQWVSYAQAYVKEHAEIDLHLQMISTIAGAKQLFSGEEIGKEMQDEMWLWIPFTDTSIAHATEFLSALAASYRSGFTAECYGQRAQEYAQLVEECFGLIPLMLLEQKLPLSFALLRCKAGLLNSRKAAVTPCLPRPVR